eukprot:233139_1
MSASTFTIHYVILSLFLQSITSINSNCTELHGRSDVSASFGKITAEIIVDTNCTVKMIFTQPADKGYTGWGFGGDYTLRGKSLMNGYSIMIDTDGTALEYELKRSRPYYYTQDQQDLNCSILNENNLLTITCYRNLYTNDTYDYYDGWSKYGTIKVMWCWDKSGGVSPGNTHTTEGFTQMTMGYGNDGFIYEIIGISIAVFIILICLGYCIGKQCGVIACLKRYMDKYCWNIFVNVYYGIFCCHFCKFKGESLVDDEYARSPKNEAPNHSMDIDNKINGTQNGIVQ